MPARMNTAMPWPRIAWWILPFFPLLTLQVDIVSQIPWSVALWLMTHMLLAPINHLMIMSGLPLFGIVHYVLTFCYCLAISIILDRLICRYWQCRPFRIVINRVMTVLAVVSLSFAVYAGLVARGMVGSHSACPGKAWLLQPYCEHVSDFRQYILGGFIDVLYVYRFHTKAEVWQALGRHADLQPLDPGRIPVALYELAPVWWQPPRTATTLVYNTAEFPLDGRGGDGDHYLVFIDPRTDDVFVFLQSNF